MSLSRFLLYVSLYTIVSTEEYASSATFDLDLYQQVLDSEVCQRQIKYMIANDSRLLLKWIRIPRGFFDGNSVDFGNYHQCLGIDVPFEGSRIAGKYCAIQFPIIQNLSLPGFSGEKESIDLNSLQMGPTGRSILEKYYAIIKGFRELAGTGLKDRTSPISGTVIKIAICIPRACDTVEAVTGMFFNMSSIGFEYGEEYCRLPNDKPWVAADYVAIIIFSVIGVLNLMSTAYELTHIFILKRDPRKANFYYRLFSVYNNSNCLLHYTSRPGSLYCIDGIRTVAMFWIIVCHGFAAVSYLLNPFYYSSWLISLKGLGFSSIPIVVDTFYVISGILLVYTSAKKMDSLSLIRKLHLFYISRLLRMFPLLAAMVLLDASLFHRIADGPLSTSAATAINAQRCRAYWWTTLLHLQTFINPKEMCVPHSWYIAIDIQLHLLSPVVLFWVLSGRRQVACSALMAALTVTMAISASYNYIMELPAHTIIPSRNEQLWDYLIRYYFQIISRATPFIVGMVFGYVLHLWRGKKIKITTNTVLALWSLSFCIMSVIFYMIYSVMQPTWDHPGVDTTLNTLMRPLWAFAIGWMILACVHGYGGPVNWFLSLPMWRLPSRLTYGMYLIHYPIIFVANDVSLSPQYFSVPNIMFQSLSNLLLSFIMSFVLTVVIDSPFTTLFKRLLEKVPCKKKAKPLEELELLKHMD